MRSIPSLFAVITILAYGLLLPFTGFYWDDWIFAWIAKFLGPAEFLPAFIFIRPFLIPIFFATTSLVPPVPIYWQMFALFIHFLAGLSALFVLNHVWPRFKPQILVASLLFLVFPAYSQHWVAYTHINQEWIAFILYLLSMGLTASGLRNPQKFRAYTIYALVLLFEGLFATEYFLGLEPLRFLFIWVILSDDIKGLKDGFIKSLRIWLPYLCIWLLNGVWLAWYYSQGYNAYDLEIIKEPLSRANLFYVVGDAIWKAGLYAWVQVLALTANNITAPSTILTYALISLTFIFLHPILKKIPGTSTISKTTYIQFILIGLVGIILGRVPSLAAGLPFKLQSSFDRFAISMMLGGCLFIVGLVEWLVKSPPAKMYVFALLIALGVGQQFFNANVFRRDWEKQQEFLWQLKWRIPALERNTVILTDEIAVDYESDISLVGPINWIYAPGYKRSNLPYLFLYIDSRLGGTLPALESDTDIQFAFRTVTFYGSTAQAIVIHMPENGCLHVLDPQLGHAEIYDKKYRRVLDAIHLSDTTLIHNEELAPPEFLSEPNKTWCYYYTKAELGQQLKDWEGILALEKEAANKGFAPEDQFEWLPFIEANIMLGNTDHAEELSKHALANSLRIRPGVCNVWKRVQAQGPARDEAWQRIELIISDLQCAQ